MPSRCRSALRAIAPTPTPHWPKKWRRVWDFRLQISDFRFWSSVVIVPLILVILPAVPFCIESANAQIQRSVGGGGGGGLITRNTSTTRFTLYLIAARVFSVLLKIRRAAGLVVCFWSSRNRSSRP